ncbi:MAG: hypothetical protein KGV50_06575 [Gammaproteobacteria bacterium]|nr:hypothetical protein [Gammaproteobacteria bacterium]
MQNALTEIEEVEIHGRIFITGKVPQGSTSNDWAQGLTASIAWDSV